jgi:hypothetical protein
MGAKKKTTPKETTPKPELAGSEIVGHLVTIKGEVDNFVDGTGVPNFARISEVFVSRVNPNGTAVIAYVDSLAEVGTLFTKDFIVSDEVWTRKDDIEDDEADIDIDIRIFGVPERLENIKMNQARTHISDGKIFIDENHEGVIPTAKRAWLAPTDKRFVLVMQDDIELCDNFVHYANLVAKTCPDAIISLFPMQFRSRVSVNRIPKTPYVETKDVAGQAIIMPASWVENCVNSWDTGTRGDDSCIAKWARDNDKKTLVTIPALVQHIGIKSVFDKTRSIGGTDFWRKDPSPYDWTNPTITHWQAIAR